MNKVETRVTIEVDVDALPLPDDRKARIRERLAGRINKAGVLRVTSQAERSQLANRDRALARMEELLADAIAEQAKRKPTRISRSQKTAATRKKRSAARRRRSCGQRSTNPQNADVADAASKRHRALRESAIIYSDAAPPPSHAAQAASAASAAGLSCAQLARASVVGAASALSMALASFASV